MCCTLQIPHGSRKGTKLTWGSFQWIEVTRSDVDWFPKQLTTRLFRKNCHGFRLPRFLKRHPAFGTPTTYSVAVSSDPEVHKLENTQIAADYKSGSGAAKPNTSHIPKEEKGTGASRYLNWRRYLSSNQTRPKLLEYGELALQTVVD